MKAGILICLRRLHPVTDETHVTTSQKTRNVSQCKRVFQEQFLLVATFISSPEEESTKHRLYKSALDHARRCLINYEVKYYRLLNPRVTLLTSSWQGDSGLRLPSGVFE
ncbi:3587_t:CDS:2 [Paraglomus brasilianum]|uniref:3587_t:CDS:1 n=1 Tax=Paraglomus brasilianum TaxID=144538 RepID=A0A9N8ZZL2_9GLOM|nr:3587_t:CDS:2 [Paraglomus brasilianum]